MSVLILSKQHAVTRLW